MALYETEMTWARTASDIRDEFRRWGVGDFEVLCAARGAMAERRGLARTDREVVVRFEHPDGREIVLRKADWDRPVDNFRQLYFGVRAMRDLWKRGLEDVMTAAYLQLAAPAHHRDPYEVLGVRPDAPLEVVEIAYKGLAKLRHPDKGGSAEAMAELNGAYERIKTERGTAA